MEELKFTFLSIIKETPGLESTHPINNITFDPRNKNILLLHNDTNVCVLKKSNVKSYDKVQKLDDDVEEGVLNSCIINVVKSYKV